MLVGFDGIKWAFGGEIEFAEADGHWGEDEGGEHHGRGMLAIGGRGKPIISGANCFLGAGHGEAAMEIAGEDFEGVEGAIPCRALAAGGGGSLGFGENFTVMGERGDDVVGFSEFSGVDEALGFECETETVDPPVG